MNDFSDMHAALFEAFAVPATIQRGAAAPVPVDVVVDEGQQVQGEFGQVTGQVTVVQVRVAQFRMAARDVVTIGGVARPVVSLLRDDGYVVQGVLHG